MSNIAQLLKKAEEKKAEEKKEEQVEVKQEEAKQETQEAKVSEQRPVEVYLIHGFKGTGKTTFALSFPGNIACLAFDVSTATVHMRYYKGDKRITVVDGSAKIDSSTPRRYLESCEESYNYIIELLSNPPFVGADYIVLDNVDKVQQISEMTMRLRNGLSPFQGISNLNLWKERNLYNNFINMKAVRAAKRGVVYTVYTEISELMKDGEVIERKEVPKWVEAFALSADDIIALSNEKGVFYATVESSKLYPQLTGKKFNVTGIGWKGVYGQVVKL